MPPSTNEPRAAKRQISEIVRAVVAILVTIGFFGVFAAVFLAKVESENKDMLLILLGGLGTMTAGVFNYYFGSSDGSKEKTAIMGSAKIGL